jgi:hypothetical protein
MMIEMKNKIKEKMNTKMDTNTTEMKEMYANMITNQEQMLAKMEANRKIDREERRAKRKADQEDLQMMMEEMLTVNQAKTDLKLKGLTETIGKTCLECEEPTSADMKSCQ